ncbi:hypothetical protein K431DRAFT_219990 [Polychaeton citri CBS 116435]|uniref:Uncharacterized protein n=1 Tax=Polychaeton citri CBS 116435 TaxID=1314669 RepID=A0A9P4USB4_9PEZI|nr:hypothetical protein K431DRAFT_219990 [Polychaeton citri CBS 116435]
MASESGPTQLKGEPSFLNTSFPVLTPNFPELLLPTNEFDAYVRSLVAPHTATFTLTPDVTADSQSGTSYVKHDAADQEAAAKTSEFMDALLSSEAAAPLFDGRDGKMRTRNNDVAHRTSKNALVDLFTELEDIVSGERLEALLTAAWEQDAEATLRIIWNGRSIHLGKSSRPTFYRAAGWLAQKHPATLLSNLPWLVRPLIQKKAPTPVAKQSMEPANAADDDAEMIRLTSDDDLADFDVKFGVSHGYWKDLLNMLVLAANGELKATGDPRRILNVEKPNVKKTKTRDWSQGRKRVQIQQRHDSAMAKLESDPFYKALYLTVTRLFADQLRLDTARLRGDKANGKLVTLAGKWAPTTKCMHDQHTSIVSNIAELLHPFEEVCADRNVDPADRTLYLKYAREAYQRLTLSPLRGAINIVERPVTDGRFNDIKYDRVPSLAMKQYLGLFIKNDIDRFEQYLDKVGSGKAQISGATLLPSTLVKSVRESQFVVLNGRQTLTGTKSKNVKDLIAARRRTKEAQLAAKATTAQWNTLCQRVKDSGLLQSSIAVCDVSGSMSSPRFADGTCPMDSAIGLSLLMAEITEPPFGGAFITFSNTPQVMHAGGKDDKRSLEEKVQYIERSNWSMNTNFVAVFEELILPMALKNKLKPEDMVKQIFVFSDMHFDSASGRHEGWYTSFERIQKRFKEAGYEMPKLIFWNLAGGSPGYNVFGTGDEVAPKPATAAEENTALVSGYSQGQMKMFLENGQFHDPPEEEEIVETETIYGEEVVVEKKTKKSKMDPESIMRKAISHEAYRMLTVVD